MCRAPCTFERTNASRPPELPRKSHPAICDNYRDYPGPHRTICDHRRHHESETQTQEDQDPQQLRSLQRDAEGAPPRGEDRSRSRTLLGGKRAVAGALWRVGDLATNSTILNIELIAMGTKKAVPVEPMEVFSVA